MSHHFFVMIQYIVVAPTKHKHVTVVISDCSVPQTWMTGGLFEFTPRQTHDVQYPGVVYTEELLVKS